MINFLKYKPFAFIFSGILVVASVVVLVIFGLRLGTDFTGGTLWELDFPQASVSLDNLRDIFVRFGITESTMQRSETGVLIRTKVLTEELHQQLLASIASAYPQVSEVRFESVGPVIGQELQRKAIIATALAIVGILLYVALAFRRVQKPSSSLKFALSTIIALAHDVLITVGIFSILGRFLNVEIGLPFVAAILTILGYSVNDTVVVFDRVRENLLKRTAHSFNETVELSLNQTLGRSIITSMLVILTLLAIFLWGGSTIKYFALALLVGIGFGTYSSIFVATFLLAVFQRTKANTHSP